MARYIDADKLYTQVKEKTNPYGKPTLDYESGVKVLDMIERTPTADVVEVVRCKDCKNRRETIHGSYCLPVFGLKRITDLDAYCSYGERSDTDK